MWPGPSELHFKYDKHNIASHFNSDQPDASEIFGTQGTFKIIVSTRKYLGEKVRV